MRRHLFGLRHVAIAVSRAGAIERGEFNLSLKTIAKIGAGLDMSLAELFKCVKL